LRSTRIKESMLDSFTINVCADWRLCRTAWLDSPGWFKDLIKKNAYTTDTQDNQNGDDDLAINSPPRDYAGHGKCVKQSRANNCGSDKLHPPFSIIFSNFICRTRELFSEVFEQSDIALVLTVIKRDATGRESNGIATEPNSLTLPCIKLVRIVPSPYCINQIGLAYLELVSASIAYICNRICYPYECVSTTLSFL